jgi:hypothetical protein
MGRGMIFTLLHNDIHALRQKPISHVCHDFENRPIGHVQKELHVHSLSSQMVMSRETETLSNDCTYISYTLLKAEVLLIRKHLRNEFLRHNDFHLMIMLMIRVHKTMSIHRLPYLSF